MENNYPELPEYIRKMIDSGEEIDNITLDKEGLWFHNGEKFLNEKIIDYFNKSVNITSDGQYVIHYGNYTYPINVEDTAVFITGVVFKGFGDFESIEINTSAGKTEELDISTLYVKSNNALYCTVMDGKMPAKFRRSPSFHILDRLEEGPDSRYYLNICGTRIELKSMGENQ